MSPGKESPSSFPLQLIPGDMSPGISFPSDKSPGKAWICPWGKWFVNIRCEAALEVLPEDMEAEAKAELNKKAPRRDLWEELIAGIHVSQGKSQYQSLEVEDSVLKIANLRITRRETVCKNISQEVNRAPGSARLDHGFRCSYHMTPRLDILFDFLECDGGSVQLGDNRECKIRGIGKVRIQLKDGSSFVLHNVSVSLRKWLKEKYSLAQVWHKRLGHISEAGLQVLEKQGLFGKKSLGGYGFIFSGSNTRPLESSKSRTDNAEWVSRTYEQNRSPSTTIEKKTPMEMWSGHPSDYGIMRIFGCVAYSHVKKVTSRDVVFNESAIYKDTLKDSGVGNDKSVEELQVEVELQRLNNHTLKEDQNNQEDGDDEDARDQEIDQTPDLTDYQLTQDRAKDTDETFEEAVACEDSSKWKAAIQEAMDSLRKNKTWELVDPPAGQKLVSSKWLFKIKEGIEGVQKPRYKARLAAHGFTQRAGIDYNKVFSPVVRHTSTRVILALTACKDYDLERLDVKTTFLHGNLEEVIYMRQPPGYEQGNKVCFLKKSLYGLKQSPRQWYRRFGEYMLSNGFKRSSIDICVYYKSYAPGEYIYLLLYVDDMLIACKSKAEIGSTNSLLKNEFDMKELGEAKKILGMEINRQREIGSDVIGWALQAVIKGLPEARTLCMRVSVVSRYLANPGGSFITEAEYMDTYGGCVGSYFAKGDSWMRAAIHFMRNIVFHERTKHINVRYHFIREVLEAKTVKVLKVGTEHNAADALTKVVPGRKLQHCLELLKVGVG
ncbi:retrotransposon protein, putative, ty1-copia subclass [Tanacetum coccineum]